MVEENIFQTSSAQRRCVLGLAVLVSFLLLVPTQGCPGSSAADGLDGTHYTCTASDAADCTVIPGEIVSLTGDFAAPERTGVALAAGGLGFTVKCAAVSGQGITGSDTLEAKVSGCYGVPSFSIDGAGSIVVDGTADATACPPEDCVCSYANSAWVGTHPTFWNDDGDTTYDDDNGATFNDDGDATYDHDDGGTYDDDDGTIPDNPPSPPSHTYPTIGQARSLLYRYLTVPASKNHLFNPARSSTTHFYSYYSYCCSYKYHRGSRLRNS